MDQNLRWLGREKVGEGGEAFLCQRIGNFRVSGMQFEAILGSFFFFLKTRGIKDVSKLGVKLKALGESFPMPPSPNWIDPCPQQ